ncbi:hypothetical protein SAMN05444745_1265 [Arthrobacter sp. OV608]|nr:hypothetical protein SAMN05444745_1265 [Arthrobacter sp. OV608]
MVGVFTPSDEKLLEQRKMLMTEHPQLIQRQWARMIGVESASSDIHVQVEETLHTLREVLRTLP